MKITKKFCFLLVTIVSLLQTKKTIGVQNPAMILAPKYYNGFFQDLPTGIGTNYYNGQAAQYAQNIMLKPDGTILFFIVDDNIYNAFGRKGTDHLGGGYTLCDDLSSSGPGVTETELLVIPDPGNCNAYYIIYHRGSEPLINYVVMPSDPANNNSSTFKPFFCDPMNYCTISDGVGIPKEVWGGKYIREVIDTPSSVNFASEGPSKPHTSLGVTKLRSDNSRLLIIHHSAAFLDQVIYIYKISATSFSYLGTIPTGLPELVSETENSELEITEKEDPSGMTDNPDLYRIAYTGGYDQFVVSGVINVNTLTASGFNTLYNVTETLKAVNGIEFSENGKYLYMITDETTDNFKYYNYVTSAMVDVTTFTNEANYKTCKLELDFNGNLFLAKNTKYMSIANSNTPATFSSADFTEATFPGAFTYPSGFLQDQIDGMDYTAHFSANLACCIQNNSYNKIDFTATTNATWTSLNPIGPTATVTIGHELRIPAGKVITISGMTIKFAPGAKLIIEDGGTGTNGGRLTLINSTLTVDPRCDQNKFWEGVEIWGNNTLAQGTFSSGKQGWMVMSSNSIIEKARYGVICAKRDASNNIIAGGGGGIVQGGSSSINTARIRNCLIGARIADYTFANSISSFERFTFETTAPLIEPFNPKYHLHLINIKGISLKGCIFQNTNDVLNSTTYETTSNIRGYGIESRDADYKITTSGTTIRTKFNNLSIGIDALGFGSTNTYACQYADFTNCVKGIYNFSVDLSTIKNNTFKIYPMVNTSASFTAYGLYLNSSTGYGVWANDFTQNGTSTIVRNTKGLIVNNSGTAVNLIYNNSFHRLKVGLQVIGINGVDYTTSGYFQVNQGLNLKCNYFYDNLLEADIALTSAPSTIISLLQGNCLNLPTSPAGNRFSLNTNNSENDIYTDANVLQFQYTRHLSPASVIPILFDPSKVAIAICSSAFVLSTACPTIPVEGISGLMANVSSAESSVNSSLLAAEESGALVEGVILDETDQNNLLAIDVKETDLAIALNKLEAAYLTDFTYSDGLGEVINVLDDQSDIESQRRLAMAYLEKGNTTDLESLKVSLLAAGETEFISYLDVLAQIGNNVNYYTLPGLATNSALMSQINALATQTEDVKTAGYASSLLCEITGICPIAIIPELEFTGSGARTLQTSESSSFDLAVYPNPVQDVLEIQIDNQGKLNCQIFDLSGKLIKAINLNEAERTFSTSFLTSGVYFLEIKTEGNIKQLVRLVKE